MITKLRIAILAQLTLVLPVGGVTMTLNPQFMVVGSSSVSPVTMLEMRCSNDGTLDINYLIQLKILRRKFTETSFTSIALWNYKPGSLNGEALLEPNLPQDILSRTPNVSANIDPSQKSGVLAVFMNGLGLTCGNQAEFNCSMSYMVLSNIATQTSEKKNFTVTAIPNDVLMDSAEYYDNAGDMRQLTNNMQLNVGTRIKYKCTANIGSLPTGEIMWDMSPELQGSNAPFIPYTPTITTDIVQEASLLQQDGCSYKRISTMYYNLTSNDYDGISFRCRARSYIGSQWYEAESNQQFRTVAALPQSSTKYAGTVRTTSMSHAVHIDGEEGSHVSISDVIVIALGVLFGVSVVLNVILSICLHRYRILAIELQRQPQSRLQMYDGLNQTVEFSAPYAILNRHPPGTSYFAVSDNRQQSDYLNAYDRLNRTVGHSEPYDMLGINN